MKEERLTTIKEEDNALSRMIAKINKEAEKQAELIRRETKKKLEEMEKETRKLVEEIKEEELSKETSRIDFIRKRTETEYQQNAKKITVQARENLIDQVFEQVEKEILKFRENKKYSEYLENLLNSTIKNISTEKMKIIGDKKDKEILNKITSAVTQKRGINFKIDTSSVQTLGGFIITDEDERIKIDYTIENTLKISNEKIRSKINEILFT